MGARRMETDYNPVELSSMSGFEEGSELNGFEGTDIKDMQLEAEAVVNDVLFAVNSMFVSKSLRCADDVAYINVETKERNRYCLELTEAGLRCHCRTSPFRYLTLAFCAKMEAADTAHCCPSLLGGGLCF
ncbi:GSK3B-interacting protein isoform X3 [Meriones unguiculatus]|uniref:GSK3B-interacting protein isoform X3 n=1 Tax=Meriones unguiculatus TaxID=10047 RepID=UPI00293E54C5|nr:GSK3B-interacting protein isoform X3 [Meriones unguiculatus]